ncbi:glycosyltransferase family 61 protein [Rhodomicrobium vannielii ATCC 17100]|uniref:glycosyltransferase family 61 protein n=1 Tax=Rhodomicrobium vannielii TaxID=1069 RepID=UPI00191B3E70|nr:glycosyltransferase family 61 protein [Rhodomicrobium vannielii]MBJ7533212.1 glycosyltransferase family 61 protein [Rhodomicrobium vannielii ATCC 17100]
MVSLQYKGRIHRGKFTARSLRYILSDQAARLFPPLQRRWLLPVDSQPIWDVASGDVALPSVHVDATLPDVHRTLRLVPPTPLQLTDHIYTIEDVVVTGWAGAMMKDGMLLTVRPQHNWVSGLRARPHRLRTLSAGRPWFNLMTPVPARGHIFHWLCNYILPLLSFLESGRAGETPGLLVNANPSPFQERTVAYLKERYGIDAIEALGPDEAARVPRLLADVPVPHNPRGLQSPLGLARLDDLGRFVAGGSERPDDPKRLYISRNDARLRRVLNEHELMPILRSFGFERVVLGKLPIERQVALLRNAEAVVAPHGAGLAHIAWAKPGTKVREFFPDLDARGRRVKNATYNFWLISQLVGHDYGVYLAGPIETKADGFRIDEALFRDVLANATAVAASALVGAPQP